MAFLWNKRNVEIATVLSRKGFSAREAAEVIGTTRSSLLGRSRRMGEFHFSKPSGGTPPTEEEFNERVEAARVIVAGIVVTETEVTIETKAKTKERRPAPTTKLKAISKKVRKNQPTLERKEKVVERPLSEADKNIIFSVDGANEYSVPFFAMDAKHCRWIVSEIDGHNTMVCGKANIEGSPYCQHHHERSVRVLRRPKKLETANTNLKAAMRTTGSSLPKKSCVVTESSSS